jgi:hypothetical protein
MLSLISVFLMNYELCVVTCVSYLHPDFVGSNGNLLEFLEKYIQPHKLTLAIPYMGD